jgi:hypothetical protein
LLRRGPYQRPTPVGVFGNECAHDGRIELLARLVAKHGQRGLMGQALSIRSRRGDRIERIRHRNETRSQRDQVICQPAGIARAVKSLVMMTDDAGEVSVPKSSDHLRSVLNMAPHHRGFLCVQLIRLEEYIGWGV